MKLYLFGGAEIKPNNTQLLKDLIKLTILEIHPLSVLHIPYARLISTEEEWKEGWFKDLMQDTDVDILDARNDLDLEKASDSLIFINGGVGRYDLINGITNNKKLLQIVLTAQYIVAESAGSMIMGEYQRVSREESKIIKGLGILQNTIIEPHYSERHSEQLLLDGMKKSGMKFGIGIDSVTAIVVDPTEFPSTWSKIGNGLVDVKISNY